MTAQIPMNIRINNQGNDTLTFWPTDGPNMAIVGMCSHILKPTRTVFLNGGGIVPQWVFREHQETLEAIF